MVFTLATIFLLRGVVVGQTRRARKLCRTMLLPQTRSWTDKLLEGHRLLDAEKVMGLFTSSPDIFFIAPGGDLFKGRDQVRQSWKQFFASLESNFTERSTILLYLPAGDGVIAVGSGQPTIAN